LKSVPSDTTVPLTWLPICTGSTGSSVPVASMASTIEPRVTATVW
jgi:hypothetical protein